MISQLQLTANTRKMLKYVGSGWIGVEEREEKGNRGEERTGYKREGKRDFAQYGSEAVSVTISTIKYSCLNYPEKNSLFYKIASWHALNRVASQEILLMDFMAARSEKLRQGTHCGSA